MTVTDTNRLLLATHENSFRRYQVRRTGTKNLLGHGHPIAHVQEWNKCLQAAALESVYTCCQLLVVGIRESGLPRQGRHVATIATLELKFDNSPVDIGTWQGL